MNWFKSKQQRLIDNLQEEHVYELVASEVADEGIRPGLWAKARAETDGDIERAKARYLKLRSDQVKLGIEVADEMVVKIERLLAKEARALPPAPKPPAPAPAPAPAPKPPEKSWRCLRCGPTFLISGYSAPDGVVCGKCKGHQGLY